MPRTNISGPYVRVNTTLLHEKASRDDPRRIFYLAMLTNDTYERYLADVGQQEVLVEGYKANPITGRMEILYCRRNGWIQDAPADGLSGS
jgi:hypothetical protein